MIRLAVLTFLCCSIFSTLLAQDDPQQAETDQLEQLLLGNEDLSADVLQIRLDYLQQLASEPLSINKIDFEDWMATGLVSEAQVLAFLLHLQRYGDLLELEELQSIEGWDMATIRRILPYVQIGKSKADLQKLGSLFFSGKKELLLRTVFPRTDLIEDDWEGGEQGYFLRLRSNAGGRVRWGITAENDPGEAFFAKSNKQGFDFYSAHLFINDLSSTVKSLALGDFQARFGQGLLFEPGFATGKSAQTTTALRASAPLRAYSSQGEVLFFRGIGTTLQVAKNIETTLFYSNRKKDANQDFAIDTLDGTFQELAFFTSLQASGFHRKEAEIEDEKAITEQTAGASIVYENKGRRFAVNGIWSHFSQAFLPSTEAYRVFTFRGTQQTGVSADYRVPIRNVLFFGETAMSDNQAVATVNGLVFLPHKSLTVNIVHRNYPARYNAIYAAPFAETSSGTNETGLYFGLKWRPLQEWTLSAYADSWRHPWLRFRADGPSSGRDMLARLEWTRRRKTNLYLHYQWRLKEQNAPSDSDYIGLVDNTRANLRLHFEQQLDKTFKIRSRVEWSFFQLESEPWSRGALAYQEASFSKLGVPIGFSARYSLFDALDSNARLYAFESDVTSALSVPSFSGRGSRFYVNLKYAINRNVRLELRYAQTHSRKLDALAAPSLRTRDFKVQVRVGW